MMENDNKYILIDKYIYKKGNNKYRLFIRSGKYYYSCTCNSLEEAKRIMKVKLAAKVLINNKKKRNYATVNQFVDIWFNIYCMKELKTTTSYSMKQTLKTQSSCRTIPIPKSIVEILEEF